MYETGGRTKAFRPGQSGLAFSTEGLWPSDGTGTPSNGQHDLGNGSHRWRTVFGTIGRLGTVITDTGVAISTRDLIETLATLRASTLDETVDVRQALASACDKLIEKFEAMQDQAVTQDIQE